MTGEEYLELGLAYMREKNWDSALNTLLESQKRFSDLPEENVPPVLFSALGLCYAMAQDGVFFQKLAEVHPRFGTPANSVFR